MFPDERRGALMVMKIGLFFSVILAIAAATSLHADDREDQFLLPVSGLKADPAIPDSLKALRYRWGDEISSHYQIERYLQALHRAAPERTKLVNYGESYEGRSLNYLVISSAENISNLDEIQKDNLRLSDPRTTTSEQAAQLSKDAPAIIWLAYCVHGNEISPSDAALLTAYHLLADQREETKAMLAKLVVIIDPLQNPDGRDRFVNVFRESRGLFRQSNPYANEHTERWPSGRTNHYWFDMNRDWFRHSQQEVRAKVAAYLSWQPQIYVDAHEMGRNSTYYFPPPTDPKNPYLLDSQFKWFGRLGKHQAGWFDRYGFGYVTREIFDAFYPGYGSEWPTLQGGLGILWEQASARGAVIDRDDETQLTYRDGVRNHYISGLATLEFAAKHKNELLDSFYAAKTNAVELGAQGQVQHYFISNQRPHRARRLAALLARNGLEVHRLTELLSVKCTDIQEGVEQLRQMPAGSYHVRVDQPGARLLRALMDRRVDMDKKFLRRQLERNQLRLSNEIYDVTAWSMPLAFGVPCFFAGEIGEVASQPWSAEGQSVQTDLAAASVAYLIPGNDGAVHALSDLLQNDIRVHVCDQPFTLNGRQYGRGTLIAKVAGNPSTLNSILQDMVRKHGIEVVATDTAYVEEGAHMGGPDVQWVRPPKILLVVNDPTSPSSGHTWHLFDQRLKYPTTRVKGSDFGAVDLDQFNTIILPDGRYSERTGFSSARAKELQAWMQKGGTLITLRGATRWATGKDIGLLKNKLAKRTIPSKTGKKDDAKPQEVSPDSAPGAFLKASVFQDHWVTYGFGPKMDVFYTGNVILMPGTETEGRALVTFAPHDDLLVSGFCWPDSLKLIAETPFVQFRNMGRGNLIAFTDDPNFRAMYPGLQRLFINAAMFGASH